ncbi:hypothetical protein [Alicyclobacillus mengziensis]|uniref:Uncharacterized protein n=1 Tax=Alicyclobacillus mengziensis TaxID=2931921 RepID=A0A9X7Z5K7_9BACL|nr:hypothetical protein [Alicyclobacillus mengziensis]QSO46984.1 hypothetical protein JZ786_21630 [Alicyclobacillus mengziensis]
MGLDLLRIGRFCVELAASMMLSVLVVWALATFSSGLFVAKHVGHFLNVMNLRPIRKS